MISHLTVVPSQRAVDLPRLPTFNMFQSLLAQPSNSCLMRKNLPSRIKITARCLIPNKPSLCACNLNKSGSTNQKRKNFPRDRSRSRCHSQNKFRTNRHSLKNKSHNMRIMNHQHIRAMHTIPQLMQVPGFKMQNNQKSSAKLVV